MAIDMYPSMVFPEYEYKEFPKDIGPDKDGNRVVVKDAEEEDKRKVDVVGYVAAVVVEAAKLDFAPKGK